MEVEDVEDGVPKTDDIEQAKMVRFVRGGTALTWDQVIDGWGGDDDGFREAFVGALRGTGFDKFFWETPGVSQSTLNSPFSMVVLETTTSSLMDDGDPGAFDDKDGDKIRCSDRGTGAVAFPNLPKDAILVAPCVPAGVPAGVPADTKGYGHLAAFLKHGPKAQIHELWKIVAQEIRELLKTKTVYVSTNGMSAQWLHIRLDQGPKHYKYEGYKHGPSSPDAGPGAGPVDACASATNFDTIVRTCVREMPRSDGGYTFDIGTGADVKRYEIHGIDDKVSYRDVLYVYLLIYIVSQHLIGAPASQVNGDLKKSVQRINRSVG